MVPGGWFLGPGSSIQDHASKIMDTGLGCARLRSACPCICSLMPYYAPVYAFLCPATFAPACPRPGLPLPTHAYAAYACLRAPACPPPMPAYARPRPRLPTPLACSCLSPPTPAYASLRPPTPAYAPSLPPPTLAYARLRLHMPAYAPSLPLPTPAYGVHRHRRGQDGALAYG